MLTNFVIVLLFLEHICNLYTDFRVIFAVFPFGPGHISRGFSRPGRFVGQYIGACSVRLIWSSTQSTSVRISKEARFSTIPQEKVENQVS